MQKKILLFIISSIVLIIDYFTKYILTNKTIVLINNFLTIKFIKNYGAAWSILQNCRIVLIIISLVFMVLLIKYSKIFKNNIRNQIAFGLLLGGLLGNLLDRIIYGYVRDFISIHFKSFYYPIFNIADIAIVIGVFLIVIAIIKKEDNYAKN